MMFEHRPISEITDHDLINLLGDQEENLWIDFKKGHYEGYRTDGEKYKREICKDVTAMANAEGGYILIGVKEIGGNK
jgi:predicted HTH transcriptional regulator